MFSTLIGNDEVKDTLRRLLASGRMPGSLLFTGSEGVGKKLFALELAKALNCRNRAGVEACDQCSSCKRIGKSTFPPFSSLDDNKERMIWSEHGDVAMVRHTALALPEMAAVALFTSPGFTGAPMVSRR